MENLTIEKQDNILFVRFSRACNLHSGNIDEFKSAVAARYLPGMHLILDFTNLESIDSAGLTALIYLRRKVTEKKGTLKLVNVGARILKLLQITRLHRVFDVMETMEEALRSIREKKNETLPAEIYRLKINTKKIRHVIWFKIESPDSLIKANSQQFRDHVERFFDQADTFILNFDEIRNIDSAGIAALIHLKKISRQQQKKIILVYNNRVLNKLFKLYSIDDLFSQFQTDREAFLAAKIAPQKNEKAVKPAPKPKETNVSAHDFSDILFLSTNR